MESTQNGNRSRFTSGRFFRVGVGMGLASGWYVETREGVRGPFASREDAEAELQWVIQSHPRKRVSNWHDSHGLRG
ncbi:hypothetical protein J2T57_000341 [Natronocella acetinitrilica]|jgi:hypothetical protein|uniref:DUF6316 domain-containing protein n=1 Tax=Natronocella acetinitrilica TaxID=414046 RepID=A0AAE3KA95_9GAMM|nr:DUF6316 family protein [Natronocella acetinitrilica]MCP1673249.1 hypothetical protein [Natronocella acetinitrilica]